MNKIYVLTALIWLSGGTRGVTDPGTRLTRFPTVGIAFMQPDGWTLVRSDKAKTVARWVSPGSDPRSPDSMIMIDCGRPNQRTLEEAAKGLAENFNGEVDGRPTTLGGTRALRVRATNDSQTLRPVEGLAAIHDGYLYLVMGGATAKHSVGAELEAIRAGWTWIPFEPPYKHLASGDKPLSIFGGAATMDVPALMFTYPTEEPSRVLDLGLQNFLRSEPDFLIYGQLIPIPEGETSEEIKGRLAETIRANSGMKKPFPWRDRGGPGRSVSEEVELPAPPRPDGTKPFMHVKVAVVKLDEQRLIFALFRITATMPEERSTYNDLVDRIVDSIRPVKTASQCGMGD